MKARQLDGAFLATSAVMHRVLDPALQGQLSEARHLLAGIRDALTRFGASEDDQSALAASIRQLDEFFLLVVVGEFNAGKSAFINALAGQRVLEEGVTPTTAQIHVLRYGDTASTGLDEHGMRVVTAPAELLRDVHIVDTPGTNAIMREHERLTAEFVPRSDLVIFVTSADRPFTETERGFLEAIRDWGKKIVIVVNKVDIFEREAELAEVLAFVRDSARSLLGITPEVFPASARLAMRAKQGEPSLWNASRFEALERFIRDSLDEGSRFRLKLANPLGVGQALAHRYGTIADERLVLLKEDVALLEDIERQLAVYRDDLARGFELRMTAVEKVLVDMEARGHAYFEDTLRIGRVMDLLNRARIQKEFEDRVVADAPRHIDRRVTELIDWLIDQDFRQWQAVTSRLSERTREHAGRVLGAPEVGTFHQDRAQADRFGGRRSAAGGRDLRQATRSGGHCGSRPSRRDDGGRRRRRGAGSGDARHHRRVHGGGRRHRHPHGERGSRARLPRDPRATPQGEGGDAGEDQRASRAPRGRTAHGVRAGAGAERGAHRAGRRSVQPFRPIGADALDRRATHAGRAARSRQLLPQPARGVDRCATANNSGQHVVSKR